MSSSKSNLLFAAVLVVTLLFFWYLAHTLLVIFAAILLAIFLHGLSAVLRRVISVSVPVSTIIAVVLLVSLIVLGFWLLSARIAEQAIELRNNLPRAFAGLAGSLGETEIGTELAELAPPFQEMMKKGAGLLAPASWVFSTAIGFITNVVIILFVGLYLALDPQRYRRGLLSLVPSSQRSRAIDVLDTLAATLRQWTLGRMLLMLINAILTSIGLWLLGVPFALTLGLIAGLLNFVPNLGPIVASVPAILIALLQSPTQAVYVAILYLVLQSIDGYIFTPLVQERTVNIPPALTISSQLIMGVLLGAWGLLLATPLVAAAMVLINKLYVQR
jgi:predicted PurR-regulated permease PerM